VSEVFCCTSREGLEIRGADATKKPPLTRAATSEARSDWARRSDQKTLARRTPYHEGDRDYNPAYLLISSGDLVEFVAEEYDSSVDKADCYTYDKSKYMS
jgi:plastocyanin